VSYGLYDMTARINARLDDALAAQVDEIRGLTGKTLTELVEAALRAYCAQVSLTSRRPADAFANAGFIGAARGPRNLSTTYKRALTRSLGRKA
jgi:Arc/MetJ family transcription regulator